MKITCCRNSKINFWVQDVFVDELPTCFLCQRALYPIYSIDGDWRTILTRGCKRNGGYADCHNPIAAIEYNGRMLLVHMKSEQRHTITPKGDNKLLFGYDSLEHAIDVPSTSNVDMKWMINKYLLLKKISTGAKPRIATNKE